MRHVCGFTSLLHRCASPSIRGRNLSLSAGPLRRRELSDTACAAAQERLRLEIVKRPRDAEGFHLLPRRWVIERTFAWLGRNRRLAKDVESLIETSTAMAAVAVVQLLVRRLATR